MSIAFDSKPTQQPDVLSYRQAILPKRAVTLQGVSIWSIAQVFVFFQFFIQLSAGVMVDDLMRDFQMSALGAGILTSAYYYAYVTLQTPAGIMMDRYGPRRLLSIGSCVLLVGCLLFASAQQLWLAFVARFVMGLGAAFAFVGIMYLVDKWFPRRHFALMAGLTELMGMVGTITGMLWLASVVKAIGWRHSMFYCAAFLAVMTVLIVTVIRDMPANRIPMRAKRAKRKILPGLRVLMRMRSAWWNGAYCGLAFTVITVFGALWSVPFLEIAYHKTLLQATLYTCLIFMGIGLFSPVMGIIDNRIQHRRFLMSGCALVSFALMLLIIFWISMPSWCLALIMFSLGMFTSAYVLTFAVANEIAALRIRSASIGFVNTWCVGLAPLLQPLIGLVLVLLAHRDHQFDTSHYTTGEYQLALMILPVCLVLCVWLGLMIPPRRHTTADQ